MTTVCNYCGYKKEQTFLQNSSIWQWPVLTRGPVMADVSFGRPGQTTVTVTYDEALAGEDASAKGFLIHKIGYTAKYGTWANSPRVNLSWGSYGLTATDGVNILLCTVTGEAPDEVWTPYTGTVTITFNPADGQMTWTTE